MSTVAPYETTPTFMTTKEVAKLLRVPPDTLLAWVRRGQFPTPVQLASGRRKIWNRAVVMGFLDQAVKQPAAAL